MAELLPTLQTKSIKDGLLDYLITTFALADDGARQALADFRTSLWPDRRFQELLRRGVAWDEPIGRLSARLASHDGWREVLGAPRLTAAALRPELASLWEEINREMYDAVAHQLRRRGFPTIEHDGQLEELSELSRRANELGARYDMTTRRARADARWCEVPVRHPAHRGPGPCRPHADSRCRRRRRAIAPAAASPVTRRSGDSSGRLRGT